MRLDAIPRGKNVGHIGLHAVICVQGTTLAQHDAAPSARLGLRVARR